MKDHLVDLGIPPGVAEEVVASYGHRLDKASVTELTGIDGMGEARARRIHAAFALARSMLMAKAGVVLNSPEAVWQHLRDLGRLEHEELWVIRLDLRNRVLGLHVVARGSKSQCHVQVDQIFIPALREGAARLIVCHNHPSGDPTASLPDYAMTRQLVAAGELLGVPVIDHIIIAREGYRSCMKKEKT